MYSNATKRLIKGIGANFYGQMIITIIQLFGVPILLHYWGAKLYGEWLILTAIPTYLSMTDLGFAQTIANDMTSKVAKKDYQSALVVFQSLIVLITIVSIILISILLVLSLTLPLGKLFHFTQLSTIEASWILLLLGTEIIIKLFDGINHAGYRSKGEYATHRSYYFSTMLIQHAGIWLTAFLGGSPIIAAAQFMVIRIIITPSITILLVHRCDYLEFGFRYAKIEILKTLFRPALANIAIPLAHAVNIQGMVIVIGKFLGPLSVVVFSTIRTLTRLTIRSIQAISQAFEPELARMSGFDNKIALRDMFINNLNIGFYLALIATSVLYLFGEGILTFWTNGKVQMDLLLFRLLLISAFINVFWDGGLILLKALNIHLKAALMYLSLALLSIILSGSLILITHRLPFAGLGIFSMDALMSVYIIYVTSKMMELRPSTLILNIVNINKLINKIKNS